MLAALPMALTVFGLSHGVLPQRLCQAAGVSPTELLDRDRFVPHAWYFALLDALQTLCPSLPVGVAFGRFITPDHFGYAGQVFRNASHGLDALNKLVRFGCLFDSQLSRYSRPVEVDGELVRVLGSRHVAEQRLDCIEAALFGLITQLDALTERPVRVLEFHCHLTDERHRHLYQELLGCPIKFGSEYDGLVFARESLLQPLRGANPAALERIEAYMTEAYGSPDESFVAKLELIVRAQLHNAAFSQREAAHALGVGVRTLERRLQRRGERFGQLVERARRDEALRMLGHTHAAIYEIAFCLGYQDVSSFNRAFKRWQGTSPRAYREAHAGALQLARHGS